MASDTLAARSVRSFDGTELAAYVIEGPKPGAPVVLLIGPPGAGAVAWRHQLGYLAARFRVVTWDWRGLGASRSPSDRSAVSVADQSHDAAAVLAAVDARSCAVVAWGEGAQIGLDLAHRAPAIVSHLALVCPRWSGPFARALGLDAGVPLVAGALRALAPATRRLGRLPGAGAWIKGLGLTAPTLDVDLFTEVAARVSELDAGLLSATEHQLATHADAPSPESLTMPILVVAGTRDRLSSPLLARRLARRFPYGELFVVEDASAWAPLEYPELLNLRIEKFLERNGFA